MEKNLKDILDKLRTDLEDEIISDDKLEGMEKCLIEDFSKRGVDYNIDSLKGFLEGIKFTTRNLEENNFKQVIGLAIVGVSKLIRKKKEFQKKVKPAKLLK